MNLNTKGNDREASGTVFPTDVEDFRVITHSNKHKYLIFIKIGLAAGVAVLLLCSLIFYFSASNTSLEETRATASSVHWVTVEPQEAKATLDMSGTVAASQTVPIPAPFDGVIREKRVQLGDMVRAGDMIVIIDVNEIMSRYRDAQSAYLKAEMAYAQLQEWSKSPDVMRSRRNAESGRSALDILDRQVNEAKALLEQGIVSRNEYDGLVQQRATQKDMLDGAQADLADALSRGNDSNLKLAELDLDNAKSRMADLKQQIDGAKVVASISGVLIRAPIINNQTPVVLEPGAAVTRGAALFAIADTSTFVVNGVVDEIDVNKIQIGQAAAISSDAFSDQAISGKIIGISAEASAGTGNGDPPKFQIRVAFSAPNEMLRAAIKIGMSARVTVDVYSNPQALLVPPEAILNGGDRLAVIVMDGQHEVVRTVTLGRTFPAGVEVTSGVGPGTVIQVSELGQGTSVPDPSANSGGGALR